MTDVVAQLQLLRADHAAAILDFETVNRAYFAASVSDRGDGYFERFAEQHEARLAEQRAGEGAYYVLVAPDGTVLGRFNVIVVADGVATLGYRVAQRVSGRGVATATVRDLCRIAVSRHGLRRLRAAAATDNPASGAVLRATGFTPVGPADPDEIGGRSGTWYERDLTADGEPTA